MDTMHYLLPFVDVSLTDKSEEGKELRRLLNIDRTEACMLSKKFNVDNIIDLIQIGKSNHLT